MEKIVLVTGGFDPIHSGHLEYLNHAKKLGNRLIVGVNSDDWLIRKKGRAFMPFAERRNILHNIRSVDFAMGFDDSDGSACEAIRMVRASYPQARIVFANGGDRTSTNIPEMDMQDPNLEFAFGIGGTNKINSSSWILEEWKHPKTQRPWGYYRVLHEDGEQVKVKELVVKPGARLSMQRHQDRAEHWFVSQGQATVYTIDPTTTDSELFAELPLHSSTHIKEQQWHQLVNEGSDDLHVVEIQYGRQCIEEDIQRR
jgi:cytidyltransferase-like protein